MVAAMNSPPATRTKPQSVKPRKVLPPAPRPTAEEEAQLRRDRISAAAAVALILALIAFLIWASLTGEAPETDMMWESSYLY